MELIRLFQEKAELMRSFLERTKSALDELRSITEVQARIGHIDDLTTDREQRLRMLQALDIKIENERTRMSEKELRALTSEKTFADALLQIPELISEIQLTDQSLFLYIQSIGGEVREDLLRQLRERQAVSKFKSQDVPTKGEGLDKTL
jgi:hypothetical protein